MDFHGFQKVTLLDYPNKVACTVFLDGCNFRCPFCHNATLVENPARYQKYSDEEVLRHLRSKQKVLDGICITGGEPLLHDIAPFLTKVKEMGLLVKIDHNGTMPKKLDQLITNGLVDYVAVDIKNSPQKYGMTVGIPHYDIQPIRETVALLLRGNVDYEFRTTVAKELHEELDFREIGEMIQGAKQYFLQQYVDSGDILHHNHFTPCSKQEMQHFADIVSPYVHNVQLRGL